MIGGRRSPVASPPARESGGEAFHALPRREAAVEVVKPRHGLPEFDLAGLHCKQVVIDNPRLRCLIFDSRGRGGGPIAVYEHPKLRTGELTGPFRRWFSATLILASIVLIWADWRSDFERMWPSILAWKLLTTALVFITWEFALFVQTLLEKRGIQMR